MENRVYYEDAQSINLMQVNAYYHDKEELCRKKSNSFFQKKKAIIKRIFKYLFSIKSTGIKKLQIAIKYLFSDSVIDDKYVEYDFEHSSELDYKYRNINSENRLVIYTSIYGDYDDLQEPLYVNSLFDYYVVTDKVVSKDSVWKKYDDSKLENFESMDAYHKSKYCKLNPHVLFPQYDISIWIDGNVKIVGDPYCLVDRLNIDKKMASFENYRHDCIYTEGNYILYNNLAKTDVLLKQLADYKKKGFPKHFGMREFSIIVRRHNDNELVEIMSQWWSSVNKYSMRDQISLPYILWERGLTIDYIQQYSGNWRKNPRFYAYKHLDK